MGNALLAIYERLIGDDGLKALLPNNSPFYDKKAAPAKKFSIVPAGMGRADMAKPFITIQEGVSTRIGYYLIDESFWIRVYNTKEKSYVDIDEIADTIITLLDRYEFSVDNKVHVRTLYESTLQAATDESLDLNFRELRFRMYLL